MASVLSLTGGRHHPNPEAFKEYARSGAYALVPVFRQITSDALTPVLAYARIARNSKDNFLFESVIGGERPGRYTFLGADPFEKIEVRGNQLVREGPDGQKTEHRTDDPLGEVQKILDGTRAPHFAGLPRFLGGAVGFMGYDTVRYMEDLPNVPKDDRQLPDLVMGIYRKMVIFDQITKMVFVVVHAPVGPDLDGAYHLDGAYKKAAAEVDRIIELLASPESLPISDIMAAGDQTKPYVSNFEPERFEQAVEKCKEYIRAGDIFQVVLSQRLETTTTASPLAIYRALRVVNPSPFLFLVRFGDLSLIGSSPEIMVRAEEGQITIRPLAGTRPRGKSAAEDEALAAELLSDPKERAEHIMLVDLGRNDVGRVARFGTVTLNDVLSVEKYSHVMHLCSTVKGELEAKYRPMDALKACLPAGTLSGAPKVRAMEIIDELEPCKRGPYGGAVGYVDYAGNMDTCIALRTIVMKGQTVHVQAGAGIVADSVPALEREETLNKARGLLRAIEVAEKQFPAAAQA